MRDLIVIFLHAIVTVCRIPQPGGVRSVIAESVLSKHQLLILNRSRRRAPNLRIWDRIGGGFCSLFVKPVRLARVAIALKPSTLLNFHRALICRKYQLLFSPKRRTKPGPKGPDVDVIRAVVEMTSAIRLGAVRALPIRSIWLSAPPKTRMSCGVFWRSSINQ
jgi:putative transposase